MNVRSTVVLDLNSDEGIYTVTVPALPGCISEGADVESALAKAWEAITVYVRSLLRQSEPVPEEGKDVVIATVDASVNAVGARVTA